MLTRVETVDLLFCVADRNKGDGPDIGASCRNGQSPAREIGGAGFPTLPTEPRALHSLHSLHFLDYKFGIFQYIHGGQHYTRSCLDVCIQRE